ncbi:hypothetical protein QTN25_005591 [Entamoeba marina]
MNEQRYDSQTETESQTDTQPEVSLHDVNSNSRKMVEEYNYKKPVLISKDCYPYSNENINFLMTKTMSDIPKPFSRDNYHQHRQHY